MRKIILITGGQRSGKSVYAEKLALSLSAAPVYIATAHVWDDEFAERVKRHKERRGAQWTNIEEEKHLSRHNILNKVAVIDCLTLWCTNFFFNRGDGDAQPTVDEALDEIKKEFDKFTAQDATFRATPLHRHAGVDEPVRSRPRRRGGADGVRHPGESQGLKTFHTTYKNDDIRHKKARRGHERSHTGQD